MTTDTAPKKILVVDDDADLLLQMELHLKSLDYEVITADSERDAEAILQDIRPDMAILDLMMDHMDSGFVLCYKIKKKDPTIPIILVTGVTRETGMEFDAATEEERGWLKADAFLAKPIRLEQLKREMDRLLKG